MKKICIAGAFILFAVMVKAQNVGIGVPVPLQKLDVNGAIRLGNTVTNNAGTLRFNIGRFEGYDGLNWNWLYGFKLPLDTTIINVAGGYGLKIISSNLNSGLVHSAIAGLTNSYDGVGLYGENFSGGLGSGNGVLGASNGGGAGVKGINIGGIGVEGTGGTVGILGTSSVGNGVESLTDFGIAIKGTALGFGGIGLDISAANNASSTAAIFRHPIINGKALIVEKGFVGIGEISPNALLSVKGTEVSGSGLAAAITLQNDASSNKWYLRAGGPGTITPDGGFSIADNTDYRFIIGATGNIGLGIAPSTAKLDVNGAMKIQGLNTLEFGAGVTKETNAGKIGYQTFTTGATGALDIIGAGTLVSNRKIKFWVEGGATFTGQVLPDVNSTSTITGYSLGSSTLKWKELWAFNGVIQTSDAGLKRNISPSGYGLKEIMQMQPVKYQWKNESGNSPYNIGFLAQDIQKIIPEAVVIPGNGDAMGMKYNELMPVLVKAIQEQQVMIETLKKQNESFLKRLEIVEKK